MAIGAAVLIEVTIVHMLMTLIIKARSRMSKKIKLGDSQDNLDEVVTAKSDMNISNISIGDNLGYVLE